jgi:LCP family protein required for cell wall assembly
LAQVEQAPTGTVETEPGGEPATTEPEADPAPGEPEGRPATTEPAADEPEAAAEAVEAPEETASGEGEEPAAAGAESTPPPDRTDPPEDDEAPVGPTRSPRWARVLVVLGTVIALLAGGSYTLVLALEHRYDHSLPKADLLDPGARAQPANARHLTIQGPLNFLLLGSDARAGDPIDGQRSDTIMILHIPATMDRAYLLSIPRDLRVHIPADETTGFKGSTEKINGGFNYGGGGVGGYRLVSKTLTELTGIRFDGAAIVDFDAFRSVVHMLGGVDMCVDQETKSIHTGITYHIGCQHLPAWQALDFVRQRELLPDGDYDRQRHQQQFLRAILQEARDQGLERNPVKLDQFIRSIAGSLVVDTNGVPVPDLAFALRNIAASSIVGIRLPSHPEMIGGISYVLADPEAPGLYQAVLGDTLDAWVTDNPSWVNRV